MENLMQMFTDRRTYRRFDQSRKVSEEIIGDILEAARLSSSARNGQQLKFAVVANEDKVEEIFPMTHFAGALPKELGTPKDGEHPVLYVLILSAAGNRDVWMPVDAGIASANMTLAAWNHGVGSCIMGAIDRPAIKSACAISDEYDIHSTIAFGYPTHKATIVPVGDDGSLKYYLDENKDYYVPKKSVEEISFRI